MAGKTDRFNLQTLESGDDLSEDGYAFTMADRNLIDRLLTYATEQHRHTGETADELSPVAPELSLDTQGGDILAGERVRYVYTIVDVDGFESVASDESYIDTPEPVEPPAAATLGYEDDAGTHMPGIYFYVLTAYQDFSTSETTAVNRSQIRVPVGSSTNQIILELPSLPDGATGFNVYRRAPGATKYFFLDSIDMEAATPPDEYIDDGSVDEDCDRSLPTANTTYSTNAITVTFPGGVVDAGYTWKIYRTYETNNWDNTTLHWVVEETAEDSGIITPEFIDVGEGTEIGSPPTGNQAVGSPPKIDLTDMNEVEGVLPPGRNVVPSTVTFSMPGTLVEQEGEFIWVCEYDAAVIIGCRASLGRSSYPDAQDVIVDVNKYDSAAATPAWETIYTTQANRPKVLVDEFIGDRTEPDVIDLVEGDALCVDIDQAGGGAGTDADLIVTIFMLVQSESRDTTTDLVGD